MNTHRLLLIVSIVAVAMFALGGGVAVSASGSIPTIDEHPSSQENATTSTDDDPPTPPASYYGNVTFNDAPASPGATITAYIDGEQRGSITVEETGTYGGAGVGDEKLVVNGTSEDEGAEVTFRVEGSVATTEPSTVTWESGDVSQVDLAASDPTTFDVTIDDDVSEMTVDDGENATVVAVVEHVGEEPGTRRVNVSVDGQQRHSEDVELDPGEDETVTATLETDDLTAPGAYNLTVASNGEPATGTIEVTATLETYADDGTVDVDGVRTAVGDWQRGAIDTGLLLDVIEAWQEGGQVG